MRCNIWILIDTIQRQEIKQGVSTRGEEGPHTEEQNIIRKGDTTIIQQWYEIKEKKKTEVNNDEKKQCRERFSNIRM